MSRRAAELYSRLWATKYAPLYAALREEEQTRRAEDFVEGPRPVGPWLLRPLTAYDLLICDGYVCPLTAGAEAAIRATPEQLWWFSWLLQTGHEPGDVAARDRFIAEQRDRHFPRMPAPWWRRAWAPRPAEPAPDFFADLAAVVEYVERHFADGAAPQKIDPATGRPVAARESGTNWLAGLVIALACETGWTESHILGLPLGRLWQYLKILDQRRDGKGADHSASRRVRSQCLAEVNEILAAEAAPASA